MERIEQARRRPQRTQRSLRAWLGGFAAALALAGCGGGGGGDGDGDEEPPAANPPPPATTVAFQVWPARIQLAADGRTAALAFGADGAAIAWSSSDPAVATVDASGLVAALGPGTTSISATANGKTASVPLRVWDTTSATPEPSSEQRIAEALAAGRIEAEQALLYRVFARFGDARLPAEYDGAPAGENQSVSMREVSARLASLSPAAQATLAPFFVPPIYLQSWLGVQLGVAPAASLKQSAQAQPLQGSAINCAGTFPGVIKISTEHFNVAMLPFGSTEPLARFAAMLETIYTSETALLGREPKSDVGEACNGGDGKVDVYLGPLSDLGRYAETTAYAGRCNDTPSFIVVNHLIAAAMYGGVEGDPERTALLDRLFRGALAHEFMHTLQFAMNRSAACADYTWIDEATAQWVADHVYPADNLEDGHTRWVERVRGGGWFVNYLLNDHLTSIEDTFTDPSLQRNGYTDYVFFQYVARSHGGAAIRAIFDAMAGNGSVESLDAGLAAYGGMKEVWPKFARSLWLDPDNPSLPSVFRDDGYDFGLFEVLKGAISRAPARMPGEKETSIDLQGAPRKSFELFKPMKTGGPLTMPPRSFVVDRLKFDDGGVSSVRLLNSASFATSLEGVKLEAVLKIGGRWQAPEDWTVEPYKQWCRDKADERIEEIILIASHAGPRRDSPPHVVPAATPLELHTSNVGCWKWSGSASSEIVYADAVQSGNYLASATFVLSLLDGSLPTPQAIFATESGTAESNATIRIADCTTTIRAPSGAVAGPPPGLRDGLIIFELDLPLDYETPPSRKLASASGGTTLPTTTRTVCPDFDQSTSLAQSHLWLSLQNTGSWEVAADGRTIDIVETVVGAGTGARQTARLRLTALRE